MNKNLLLSVADSGMEIQRLLSQGYCPVGCYVNGDSIVDDLAVDSHGDLESLGGIATRAYDGLYGQRRDDPRFVVYQEIDAAKTFAVAALSGLLPHPSNKSHPAYESLPEMCMDFSSLAETISMLEVNPVGLNLASLPYGDVLLAWQVLYGASSDSLGSLLAVGGWRHLLVNKELTRPYVNTSVNIEKERLLSSEACIKNSSKEGVVLLVPNASVYGFDVWHGLKHAKSDPNNPDSWESPVVVAQDSDSKSIMISCPNDAVAIALFGVKGLAHAKEQLKPDGWTGADSFIISPSHKVPTEKQFHTAGKKINALIVKKKSPP